MMYQLAVGRTIGIIVLVIVAIVVLLLVIPIRYRLDVDLDDGNGSLRVNWLFRLLRFRLVFDEDLELVLSVLFFKMDFLDEERRERRRIRKQKREERRKKKETGSKEEIGTLRRIIRIAGNVVHVLSLMREYRILGEVMPPLRLLLYRARPRDIHGCVRFGFNDPSNTGEIVGAVSAFPVIYQTDLEIVPDFETDKAYAEGDVHAKGYVVGIALVLFVIQILRSRQVRMFIGELRKNR